MFCMEFSEHLLYLSPFLNLKPHLELECVFKLQHKTTCIALSSLGIAKTPCKPKHSSQVIAHYSCCTYPTCLGRRLRNLEKKNSKRCTQMPQWTEPRISEFEMKVNLLMCSDELHLQKCYFLLCVSISIEFNSFPLKKTLSLIRLFKKRTHSSRRCNLSLCLSVHQSLKLTLKATQVCRWIRHGTPAVAYLKCNQDAHLDKGQVVKAPHGCVAAC